MRNVFWTGLVVSMLFLAAFLLWCIPSQSQTPPSVVISRPQASEARFVDKRISATVGQAFTYTPALPAGAICTAAPLELGDPRQIARAAAQATSSTTTTTATTAAKKHPRPNPSRHLSQQSAFTYNATANTITGTPTKRGMAGFIFTCTLTSGQTKKIPVMIQAR